MRDVGRNALLGSFTTAGGSLLGFALRFAMNMALARFIAPEAFGASAQTGVYAAVVGVLQAFSFPQALVQLPDSPGLAATVRLMTLGSSLALVVLGLLLWPLIAALKGDAVASCFVALVAANGIGAMGSTFEAELQRAHRWHAAAGLKLGANVLALGLVIPLGYLAPSPFILVLRDALAPMLVLLIVLAVRWRRGGLPGRFDRGTARAVWDLGKALFWNRSLEIIFHKVDSALVGELLGSRTLGLYDQARYLANLPNTAFGPISNTVGLRLLASLRDDPPRLKRAFALLQWGITRGVFVFGLGALLAPTLAVRLVYGPAWADAAPILQAFALWCVVYPISVNHQILLTALQAWAPIRLGFLSALAALVVSAPPLGLALDAAGVALAHTLALSIELVLRARGTAPHLGFEARDHLRVGLPVLAALGLGAALGFAVTPLLPAGFLGELLRFAVGLAGSIALLVAVEGRATLAELRYMRDLIRRRS